MSSTAEQHRITSALEVCRPLNDPTRHWLRTANVMFVVGPLLPWLFTGLFVIFGDLPSVDYVRLSFRSSLALAAGGLWWVILRPLRKLTGNSKVIFLRAFCQDAIDDKVRNAVRISLPSGVSLSGIRPPRERTPLWKRFLFEPLAALRYVGSNYFELEADDKNWFARLLATLSQSHAIILDLRHLTPMVHHEVKLAVQCCRQPGRLYLLIDDSLSFEEWRTVLEEVAGNGPVVEPSWIQVPRDHSGVTTMMDYSALRGVFANIPKDPFSIETDDLAHAETLVKRRDWKTSLWKTPTMVTVVAFAMSFLLSLLSAVVGIVFLVVLGIMLPVLLILALRRIAQITKGRMKAGMQSSPSLGEVRFSGAVLVATPLVLLLGPLLLFLAGNQRITSKADIQKTQVILRQLETSCESYRAYNGSGPWRNDTSEEEGGNMIYTLSAGSGATRSLREGGYWKPPYLEIDEAINDAWGTPLRVTVAMEPPRIYALSSAGPDKEFGTEDDIQDSGY